VFSQIDLDDGRLTFYCTKMQLDLDAHFNRKNDAHDVIGTNNVAAKSSEKKELATQSTETLDATLNRINALVQDKKPGSSTPNKQQSATKNEVIPTITVSETKDIDHVYTVSDVVHAAAKTVEGGFSGIWVEGEVSNLRIPASGHAYFTLKDDDAQLSIVMFRGPVSKIGFDLDDGMKIRVKGKLTIYERQGRFQMNGTFAEVAGIGALQRAFEQLKQKLAAEGLFDTDRKKELPPFPRKIALVTSRTTAALRDVLRVLSRRMPTEVILCHASVQGKEAPPGLCAALQKADHCGADVIILTRGGGSIEDLWCFNDETLARTIATLNTPIISAVGHEIDFTISDFVADLRAATPSAAAERVLPLKQDIVATLIELDKRIYRATMTRIERARLKLEKVKGILTDPKRLIDRKRMRIDDMSNAIHTLSKDHISTKRAGLNALDRQLRNNRPDLKLGRNRANLEQLISQMKSQFVARLRSKQQLLATRHATLLALNPAAILERGYSLVYTTNGQLIRSITETQVGENANIQLHDGKIGTVVQSIQPKLPTNK